MLLLSILKEKKAVPRDVSGAHTIHRCQRAGGSSSCDNRSDGLFLSATRKNSCKKKKMANRLHNQFPGMILPERQSAQLVLFHINHAKSGKFKASGEHRKQDRMSMFSHNKIIECHQPGGLRVASARRCPDKLVNVIHLFHRGDRVEFYNLSLPKVTPGRGVGQ